MIGSKGKRRKWNGKEKKEEERKEKKMEQGEGYCVATSKIFIKSPNRKRHYIC